MTDQYCCRYLEEDVEVIPRAETIERYKKFGETYYKEGWIQKCYYCGSERLIKLE